MKTLGEKLKEARVKNEMSQKEVSEKCSRSVSPSQNGKMICAGRLENFRKICHLYQVDFNEILGEGDGIESIEKRK